MSEAIQRPLCRCIRNGILLVGIASVGLHPKPKSTLTGSVVTLSNRIAQG
jgi:hypothetical protein